MIELSTFQLQQQNIANLIQQTVGQFVVRPTRDQGSLGVAGFVFDILDREETVLHSDITDNFVENNSAVQDHIALHPERFTLRGYVGELKQTNEGVLGQIASILRTIQLVQDLEPVFTIGADQAYQSISQIAEASARAVSQVNEFFSIFSAKNTSFGSQQTAYDYFYALWKTRQLIAVETPWGVIGDVAIEELSAVQPGETRFMSEFSITLKRIRIIQTQSIVGPTVPVINAANQQDAGLVAQSGQQQNGGGGSGGNNSNTGGTWPPTPPSAPSAPNYARYSNIGGVTVDQGVFSSLTAQELLPARILGPMFVGVTP